MSWHPFECGKPYSLAEVVSTSERRIDNGGVIRTGSKRDLVKSIEHCGHETLVWSPTNTAGWGASPFNPNCWRTLDGTPIFKRKGASKTSNKAVA